MTWNLRPHLRSVFCRSRLPGSRFNIPDGTSLINKILSIMNGTVSVHFLHLVSAQPVTVCILQYNFGFTCYVSGLYNCIAEPMVSLTIHVVLTFSPLPLFDITYKFQWCVLAWFCARKRWLARLRRPSNFMTSLRPLSSRSFVSDYWRLTYRAHTKYSDVRRSDSHIHFENNNIDRVG
jgi:hypothetical protein